MQSVDLSLVGNPEDWSQGYTICSYLTHLSMKFIMFINVKMSTIVGILTFISIIYSTSETCSLLKSMIKTFFNELKKILMNSE